jgi:hypothetical protein
VKCDNVDEEEIEQVPAVKGGLCSDRKTRKDTKMEATAS